MERHANSPTPEFLFHSVTSMVSTYAQADSVIGALKVPSKFSYNFSFMVQTLLCSGAYVVTGNGNRNRKPGFTPLYSDHIEHPGHVVLTQCGAVDRAEMSYLNESLAFTP